MPESGSSPRVETALVSCFNEPGYGSIIVGSKIKGFVKLTGARQFSAAWAQACVFSNFTKVHMMEAGDPNGAFLRDFIERLTDFFVRPSQGDAEVARRTHGARNLQTKIPVRKVYSPAIFGDERVAVPQFSPDGLNLLPGPGSEQGERNFSPFEFRQSFFRSCKGIRAQVNEGAFEGGKDEMARGEQGAKECSLRFPCLEAGC